MSSRPPRLIASLFLAALLCASGGARAQEVAVDWVYGTPGQGVGRIRASKDLRPAEIYFPAAYSPDYFWQAWAFDASSLEARTSFLFVPTTGFARRVEVGDVTGDDDSEIVASFSDGTVRIHDERSRELLESFQAPFNPYTDALELGDLDADGKDEILIAMASRLRAYRGDGTLLWEIAVGGGNDLAMGQMDDDPQPEIALVDGRVIDSLSLASEWQFSACCVRGVEAGDLDGDGRDELVTMDGANLRVLDVGAQSQLASFPMGSTFFAAMLIADVDGDGRTELVHRGGASVVCRDGATLAIEWQVGGFLDEPTGFALADVLGDGHPWLFWGTGATSTGPDWVLAADPRTGQLVYWSHDAIGYVGPLLGDFDGDGRDDLLVASVGEGSTIAAGGLYLLDPETGAVRRFEPLDWHVHDQTRSVVARDLDGDGVLEVFVGGSRIHRGVLRAYRFRAGGGLEVAWKADSSPEFESQGHLELGDFDGDGRDEVAASGEGAPNVRFYDLTTGQELWAFPTNFTRNRFLSLRSGGRGPAEMLVYSPDCGSLDLFEAKSGALRASLSGHFCSVAGTARELWAGDFEGRLWRLHLADTGFVVDGSWDVSPSRIDALATTEEGVWAAFAKSIHFVRPGPVVTSSWATGSTRDLGFWPGKPESHSVYFAGRIAAGALHFVDGTTSDPPAQLPRRRAGSRR